MQTAPLVQAALDCRQKLAELGPDSFDALMDYAERRLEEVRAFATQREAFAVWLHVEISAAGMRHERCRVFHRLGVTA
jgi:hypothetical protein